MKPETGMFVRYILDSGRHEGQVRAACITQVWSDTVVNLMVITDGPNDGSSYAAGTVWRASVTYSQEPLPGTWHYIEDKLT